MRLITIFTSTLLLIITAIVCIPTGYFVLSNSNSTVSTHNNFYHKRQGIGVYLINLDRSKKRLNYVQPKIEQLNLPWQRISAVDGVKLSQADLRRNIDIEAYHNFLGHSPRLGTIGCSLSHIKFWQTFLASDYEYALVFEDDVSFDPAQLRQAIDNLLANANLWDIASLEIRHHGLPVTIKKFNDDTRMVVYLTRVTDAGAYIVNRKAAENLLAKALPIKMPIDHYFTRTWELDLKFVGIEPRLVKQSYGDSEIEITKRNNNHHDFEQHSLLHKIHKVIYLVQTAIITFLYNLKIYLISKF
jgi:glycosyl transferase family 25